MYNSWVKNYKYTGEWSSRIVPESRPECKMTILQWGENEEYTQIGLPDLNNAARQPVCSYLGVLNSCPGVQRNHIMVCWLKSVDTDPFFCNKSLICGVVKHKTKNNKKPKPDEPIVRKVLHF